MPEPPGRAHIRSSDFLIGEIKTSMPASCLLWKWIHFGKLFEDAPEHAIIPGWNGPSQTHLMKHICFLSWSDLHALTLLVWKWSPSAQGGMCNNVNHIYYTHCAFLGSGGQEEGWRGYRITLVPPGSREPETKRIPPEGPWRKELLSFWKLGRTSHFCFQAPVAGMTPFSRELVFDPYSNDLFPVGSFMLLQK